jgi:hypothetical protein
MTVIRSSASYNVLPTMPASPPPVDTQPPAVPAAALR